jgi:hypothetical protein
MTAVERDYEMLLHVEDKDTAVTLGSQPTLLE